MQGGCGTHRGQLLLRDALGGASLLQRQLQLCRHLRICQACVQASELATTAGVRHEGRGGRGPGARVQRARRARKCPTHHVCPSAATVRRSYGGSREGVASAHVSLRQCRRLICSPPRRQRKDRRSCLHRASPWSRSAHPCAARPSGSAASGDCWRRSVAWCQRRRCSSPDPSALHAAA